MASVAGIKAGEAFVSIMSDDSDLIRGLKGIDGKLKKIGGAVSNVGKSVAVAGAGLAGIGAAMVGPFAAGVGKFVEFGDALNKMSGRTGFTAEALSELGFAAEQSGTSLQTLEGAVGKMQRAITDAADGSTTMQETFAALGMTIEQLQGLTPDQQFQAIAAAIAQIEDPTERAARAMQVFGKSGTKLLPLIMSDIAALRGEAEALGITLSTDDANAAAELGDAINRVGRSIKATFIQLGAAVAPPLTKALGFVVQITSAVANFAKNNKAVTATVAAIGVAFVVVGSVVGSVGVAIAALGSMIAGFASAMVALAPVVAPIIAAVAPVAGIVAGVTAGLVAIGAGIALVANEAGLLAPALEFIVGSWKRIFATFSQMFGGIVNALGSGQWGKAAAIAWAGVKLVTLQGTQTVLKQIEFLWKNAGAITIQFFKGLGSLVYKVFANIPKIAWAALRGGASIGKLLQETLAGAFSGADFASGLDPAINAAQKELDRLVMEVQPQVNASAPNVAALRPTIANIGEASSTAFMPTERPAITAAPRMATMPEPAYNGFGITSGGIADPTIDAMAAAEEQRRHFAYLTGEAESPGMAQARPPAITRAANQDLNRGQQSGMDLEQLIETAQQQLFVLRRIEQSGLN